MNTLAIILTVVVTNWVSIGEFKDKAGATFDVQEGRMQTNTVVDVEWMEMALDSQVGWIRPVFNTNRFILKSVLGPSVGERRVQNLIMGYATNMTFGSNIYAPPIWSIPHGYSNWWGPITNPYNIIITPVDYFKNAVMATNL